MNHVCKSVEATDAIMVKLNTFTRRPFAPEEVYLFHIVLCDNEIDRDGERFTVEALRKLSELFQGCTGIFDHAPSASGQTARVFDTAVMTDDARKTMAGEAYTYLSATAYMVRTEKNADLIREIDGGIKKEVSVSCTVAKQRCSICGADVRLKGCSHKKGKLYGGKLCHVILDEPTDAYEWSFVAVPAQRGAGVTKMAGASAEDGVTVLKEAQKGVSLNAAQVKSLQDRVGELEKQAALGALYRDELEREIVRLGFLAAPAIPGEMLRKTVAGLEVSGLLELRDAYRKAVSREAGAPQLKTSAGGAPENHAYRL